jgi:hypothetical protein
MDTLPISKQEAEQLLSFLKRCETYLTYDGQWSDAKKIHKLHSKLQTNLSRYEEID